MIYDSLFKEKNDFLGSTRTHACSSQREIYQAMGLEIYSYEHFRPMADKWPIRPTQKYVSLGFAKKKKHFTLGNWAKTSYMLSLWKKLGNG